MDNLDRRALLAGTAALGGAELLPYARPAQAMPTSSVDHPDAELIALAAQLVVTKARRNEIYDQYDEALERYLRPEIPPELYWRRSDFMTVWIDRDGRLAQYGHGEGARWVYEDESAIDALREALASAKASRVATDGLGSSDWAIARMEEILAAHEEWTSACKAAEDRQGLTALDEASRREDALLESLHQRLVAIAPRTGDGLAAKARAAATAWVHNPDLLAEELSHLLAGQMMGREKRKELWAVSLIVDAMALGAGSSAASSKGAMS